jgi:glycosyltransferase involved in cell wall biosynthesis
MAAPEVSVLLPYRDVAATIDEALGSLLAQRGVALEVIAIDDGSRDEGPARVARLAASDRRVVMTASGGVGIAGALALGARAARTPLLARMDGDDVCHPERLARQLALLASDERLAAVGTRVAAFPDAAVADGLRRYVAWQNSLVSAEDHARQLFVEAPLCHPSVVLRREALERVGGWRDIDGPEDYDLWLRLDASGYRMAKVPEVLLGWRHRVGRASFTDARYALERFRDLKAPHLARRLRALGRPVAVWGAGPTGKRLARALEPHGCRAGRFIDIDPRKIGGRARGVEVVAPQALVRGAETVVVAAGAAGARDLIRARLDEAGFREGDDYLCAA